MLQCISFMIITIGILCSSANCRENEYASQASARLQALATVLEDQSSLGLNLSLQRVYINPKNITITDQGSIVYTTENAKTAVLPELFSSLDGCFVRCSESDLKILSKSDDLRMWWCKTCKRVRSMDNWGRCTGCGKPL